MSLLVCGHFAMAQYTVVEKKVQRVDSLMEKYYTNYDYVEREATELYELLNTKYTAKDYKGFKIDVMLQLSVLYSLGNNHHKALEIALEALDEAEEYELPERIFRSCWIIEIMYENGHDFVACRKYLDKALGIYQKYNLDTVYSVYCVRMSSYYRFINQKDSAVLFARAGLDYANKYNNKREIRDAYMLLMSLLSAHEHKESVKYASLAAHQLIEIEDFTSAATIFTSAASTLLKHNEPDAAFQYSDSAFGVLAGTNSYISPEIYSIRSILFERKGNVDSALYYFKKYHDVLLGEKDKMEVSEIRRISEKYQNAKKEATIKNREQQLFFIIILLAVIVGGSLWLHRNNRKINQQNKIINTQLGELSKMLEQKQVLLSELQHRVKNNLQHVISILEIQKESVDFNNIDELIRENQNRIHSMALLHKKLNVAENVNDVDLSRYVIELSELVKESYDNHKKKITLNIECSIDKISVEKALPIGLIIVELVSNSMKHAFKKRSIGIITIEISRDEISRQNKLYYADNGDGFDFNKTSEKGLGQEIIKGLIHQLDGTFEAQSKNGFELMMHFK